MQFDTEPFNSDNSNKDGNNGEDDVIRIEKPTPVNDPKCQHYFIKDKDEFADENDMQSWICKNCGRGKFLPKYINVINS